MYNIMSMYEILKQLSRNELRHTDAADPLDLPPCSATDKTLKPMDSLKMLNLQIGERLFKINETYPHISEREQYLTLTKERIEDEAERKRLEGEITDLIRIRSRLMDINGANGANKKRKVETAKRVKKIIVMTPADLRRVSEKSLWLPRCPHCRKGHGQAEADAQTSACLECGQIIELENPYF